MPHARWILLALVMSTLGACTSKDDNAQNTEYGVILPFDTARVRLVRGADTVPLDVELAIKNDQHTLGLMERRHLGENAGMLFLYESNQEPSNAFWMYRTRIPLDIAFMDSVGVIRSIRTMAPCEETLADACPTYEAGVPYRAALEVNGGFFQRHKVAIGDRLLLADTAKRRVGSGRR